ncbi:MAG TPA: hypothetical protein VMD58_11545 [Acidobacteriaceae bacterium]|nr:hypothetical protein [Acidobacteriaceae bacterium]
MADINQFKQSGLNLLNHGDRSEREFWPLLADRFPSYEILWRNFIVPLTHRIDSLSANDPKKWIRLRTEIPVRYEQTAMAHYSVFYFLGRAVKRLLEEKAVLNHPEDVLFLLDSVGDNFNSFLSKMNDLGTDCGCRVFEVEGLQFPKDFYPFNKISDYRDILLHNAVIGRAIEVQQMFVPDWNPDKNKSPLERVKNSWRAAEMLKQDEWISTKKLLDDVIEDVCTTLERFWKQAIETVEGMSFLSKMNRVIRLEDYGPLSLDGISMTSEVAASGTIVRPKQ